MTKSEQAVATADHACDACGGTGDQAQRLPSIPDVSDGRHFWLCGTCGAQNSREDGECQFCECGGLDCTRASCSDARHFAPCLVCRGAGRVSDRMPVADAIADAETLRWYAYSILPAGPPRTSRRSYAFLHATRATAPALVADLAAADASSMISVAALVEIPATDYSRAAFRAVPGLRGEGGAR